ncbi:MAG TPA: ABC transporter ATP-binding protein, partial [Flavobacteriaceae bacterium]|nr:ABC transporter ATP-binding protein [Flavobacteriaceae bacterium]
LADQESPNNALARLSQYGVDYHFVAEVPSTNDLFVQAINLNSI